MLSSSSHKDKSNVDFPVLIGLPVWVLEAILSSCMARANSRATCHFTSIHISTQLRSHRFPLSNIAGPVHVVSAVRLQSVNSLSHVPRAIGFGLTILLSLFRTESSLSGPNLFSRSSTRSKRVKKRSSCQWHVAHGTENDAIVLAIFWSLN